MKEADYRKKLDIPSPAQALFPIPSNIILRVSWDDAISPVVEPL